MVANVFILIVERMAFSLGFGLGRSFHCKRPLVFFYYNPVFLCAQFFLSCQAVPGCGAGNAKQATPPWNPVSTAAGGMSVSEGWKGGDELAWQPVAAKKCMVEQAGLPS